ncbi:MAG: hypothetical protein OEZ59_13950 [Deltaproteobacteria bacterium]|nr:hypothetical protein [Deltaproteobacteria bacterium]
MEPSFPPESKSKPRRIPVASEKIIFGHLEAWANIIRSYQATHPSHRVMLRYEDEAVLSLMELFKMAGRLNPQGFELVVAAADHNLKDVPKLVRYLVEGASDSYNQFIRRDVHQVQPLF